MSHFTLSIEEELALDIERLRETRRRAEEIVRDRGWTEADEDFEIQIDEEAKVQWSEAFDLDHRWEMEAMEEEWRREEEEKERKRMLQTLP
ncbi:MAG: hypothetical protein AAB544_02705 [Patescibacteria group bacterium]